MFSRSDCVRWFGLVPASVLGIVLFARPGVAQAGPNAGGTLVWHLDPTVVYTSDVTDYCGLSGIACERDFNGCGNGYDFGSDCQAQHGNLNPTGPNDGGTYVASVLAAFPEGSCPRLSGITFGFAAYDEEAVAIVAWGACGDFELATLNWPGQFEGTAVTWSSAVVSQLVEVYWFAAYSYGGEGVSLPLAPHPTQDGSFADDAMPSFLDPIAGYSTLGLGGTAGATVLPNAGATGACCFPDGSCRVGTPTHCATGAGVYQGDGTVCQPNPCPQPTGACCLVDETCVLVEAAECASFGGEYQGDDAPCEPADLCVPLGGCCFPVSETCLLLTEEDCEAESGEFLGDETDCCVYFSEESSLLLPITWELEWADGDGGHVRWYLSGGDGFDVREIDGTSILLNGTVPAILPVHVIPQVDGLLGGPVLLVRFPRHDAAQSFDDGQPGMKTARLTASYGETASPVEAKGGVELALNAFLSGVWEETAEVREPILASVRPNPWTASRGTFRFGLPQAGSYRLEVYDVVGRLVRDLSGVGVAGFQEIEFDGRAGDGRPLSAGVYFARLAFDGRFSEQTFTVVDDRE